MASLFNQIIKILRKVFEPISIIYHLFFITFLAWLIFVKPEDEHLNKIFIMALGAYVILYGFTIFIFGPIVMNPAK